MKPKKRCMLIVNTVLFFVATALLRAFNIYVTSIAADVAYDGNFVRMLDTAHDVLLLIAYGFSIATVIFCGAELSKKTALKAASFMSMVVFFDRAFCLIYDIAVSGINIRETNTIITAVSWLTVDFLFFVCMYFGGAFISVFKGLSLKKGRDSEADGSDRNGNITDAASFPIGKTMAACSIMTVLQLASQLVICIQFFLEYDDVTVTEKTQMVGDILWVIVEYAGLLTIAALGFVFLFAYCSKKRKI